MRSVNVSHQVAAHTNGTSGISRRDIRADREGYQEGNRADAYRMLQCLAVAIRPLSVSELAELLAFDFDATDLKGGSQN
jgi:hypothetical protein